MMMMMNFKINNNKKIDFRQFCCVDDDMPSCCKYHRPTIISLMLNKSHTKKAYILKKSIEEYSENKVNRMGQ